jgi:transcriptional regulator with XRE-family HTH domain
MEKVKIKLGTEIAKSRGKLSQRKLAQAVGLHPSNMKYIEDGVNAPSHDVYAKIIEELKPPPRQRAVMDKLYTTIRKTPPPDVCETINSNQELFDVFRLINSQKLSKEQITRAKELFKTFAYENKGENGNGK